VVYGHAFYAAFARIVPVIGLQAGFVLGGAVYVEAVFQWPGLGKLLVDAILQRDLLLAQGAVLLVASLYVLVNLATDLLQRALDPRIQS
jgi:peptide/nickel transport system permease protein